MSTVQHRRRTPERAIRKVCQANKLLVEDTRSRLWLAPQGACRVDDSFDLKVFSWPPRGRTSKSWQS